MVFVVFMIVVSYELICPASYGGPAGLADRLHKAASNWTASGELEFLNEWCVFSSLSSCYLMVQVGGINWEKKS